jgi:hypothetical protein
VDNGPERNLAPCILWAIGEKIQPMAANDPQDGAEKLRQQIARLQAKLKRKQAAEAAKERKTETRRKIIVGALAINHMEKNPNSAFTKTLKPILDEYVTRPEERALFNLAPLANQPANDGAKSEGLRGDFPKSTG